MDLWETHAENLETLPIGEQVSLFRQSIDYACAAVHQATILGRMLQHAADAGVLNAAESHQFSEAILVDAKALQAGLVLFLSGNNTDREILEQLRCIFLPGKQNAGTLDDHLALVEAGLPAPTPDARFYWAQLLEYKRKLQAGG